MDINRENYESWFLDYIEGSLSAGQISQVHQFVDENPDLQKELNAWQQTLLKPDLTLVYRDKELLKRRSQILPIGWIQGLGAVAAVGLLLWLALPLIRQDQPQKTDSPVARNNQEQSSPAVPPSDSPSVSPSVSQQGTQALVPANELKGSDQRGEPVDRKPNMSRSVVPHRGLQTASPQETVNPSPENQPARDRDLQPLAPAPQALTNNMDASLASAALPVQPRSALPVVSPGPGMDALAAALPRPDQSLWLAEAAAQPEPSRNTINDRLPIEVGSLLTTAQSFTQSAGRSIAGFMSGENEWLSVLPLPTERNSEQRQKQNTEGTAEPEDDVRVVRFSVGGFKIYHRKTTKSDS